MEFKMSVANQITVEKLFHQLNVFLNETKSDVEQNEMSNAVYHTDRMIDMLFTLRAQIEELAEEEV